MLLNAEIVGKKGQLLCRAFRMTNEEQFRDSLTNTLEQLSYLGKVLQKKCSALIHQNERNIELDVNSIEYVALKLVTTLRNMKGNILALLTFLEGDIKQFNVTHQTSLFQEVLTKIQECLTCTVVIENGYAVFNQPVDKGVMVNLHEVMINQDATSTEIESNPWIVRPQSHDEDKNDVKCVCESMPESKMFNLSLRKKGDSSDTEDTDDFWEDTLSRNGVKKEMKSEIACSKISNPSSCSLDLKEEKPSEELDKDGGPLKPPPTQIDRASPIEETAEHPIKEIIAELSANRTKANDEDEVAENAKTELRDSTLILETDDLSMSDTSTSKETTHLSPENGSVDTQEQGVETNENCGQVIQQEGHHIPDEHSNSTSTEINDGRAKPPNQYEEHALWSLDLSGQGGSVMDDASIAKNALELQINGSSSEVFDIGRGDDMNDAKSINDTHVEKDICGKNGDMESQNEEYMGNKETSAAGEEPLDTDDIDIEDKAKSQDGEINVIDSTMDDIITIDDDSSDDVESQKECSPNTDVEEAIAGSRSVSGTPLDSEEQLDEQDDNLKEANIQDSSTEDSEMQLENTSNMDFGRPDVEEDASTICTKTNSENLQGQEKIIPRFKEHVIDKVGVTPDSNGENNAKLPDEVFMENLSGIDVNEKELDAQECVSAVIDFEKNKSSPQNTYACEDISDSETVICDSEEVLSKTNIDENNTTQANNENDSEQADVGHMNAHHEGIEVDSDTTYIESTSNSQNDQNFTAVVRHMAENDLVVSETAGKNVSHSRPGSKLSDCDSFVFDVKACSQIGSLGEKQLGAEDNLKQADETVVSKYMENEQSSRCDMQEAAVPDYGNYSQAHEFETKLSVELQIEESDPENEEENDAGVGTLSDELLKLFREVELSKDFDEHVYPKNPEQVEDDSDALSDYESDDADVIFKSMDRDSTDTTDSNTVDDGASSILDDSYIEMRAESQVEESAHNENIELKQNIRMSQLKHKNMDRCYVRVERVDLKSLQKTLSTTTVDDSIDRLCDLSTLNKRTCLDEMNEQSKPCHRKKRKKGGGSSDQSEDLLISSSDSDVEVCSGRGSSAEFGSDADRRLNIMLARAAMKVMGEDSTDSESEQTDDEGERKRKKKKKSDREAGEAALMKLTEEEIAKKKWRNDKLLREKLESNDSSDSSTTNDSSGSSRKKREVKKKYEYEDPDYKLDFSEISGEERRRKRIPNKDDNSKSGLSDSDSSVEEKNKLEETTDNDSDVEFVFKDVASTSPELTQTQKGHRRNIRALMSDADLEEATLRAKEAEEDRIGRLKNKQKLRESLSQCLSQSLSGTLSTTDGEEDEGIKEKEEALDERLVLDVNENTNEPLVQVDPQLTKILKSHQKSGIQFMWDCCYESLERINAKDRGSGCILAHCMGLGKTLQVLALIHTLFAYKETGTKHALVVCPLSTVSNWKKEAKLRLKDVQKNFEVFTIGTTQEIGRQRPIIKQWYCTKRSILIMGYERYECLTNEEKLNRLDAEFKTLVLNALVNPGPDLIVCDEGHLLKSKKAVKVQALNKVRTKRRIILTGTPLQNNLIEYYHMVQFVKPNLLGNLKEFKTNFVNPITNGQYEDSTKEDIKLMKKRTHVLHNYLKQTIQRFEDTELQTYLKKMHHYAVFVQLHPLQVKFYKKFLEITFMAQRKDERKTQNHRGFLSDFAVFQYICTHPYLLKVIDNKRNNNDREQDVITTDDDRPICNIGKWWKSDMPPDAENAIEYGTKLLVVKHILEECEEIGDKVLIFSQSLGELDLIEHFLKNCGTSKCPSWEKDVDYTRMDGNVKPESRSGICDRFNEKSNTQLRLLLISIRVGGLGLNLTAANRVITMTVSWNPSYDLQSVFRVYRFGQEKAVYVYRLIALDTMEEKAYQRTVTKLAVAHRVIDRYQIQRHYKSVDLQAMYSCFPTANKQRPTPNVPEDEVLAKLILKLPVIYKYHEQQALLANRPEDDLNEQEKIAAWEEFEKVNNAQKSFKEVAAMAAAFAKEAADELIPAVTFNTSYSLCPPSSSGAKGDSANNVAHAGWDRHSGQNGFGALTPITFSQAYSFPPLSTGRNVDYLTKNDTMKNGSGQVDLAKNTTQGKFGNKNTVPVELNFTKTLEELLKLNSRHKNTGTVNNRKQQNPTGGQWGPPDAHSRLFQQNLTKQQSSRPKLSQHVGKTPIDLTVYKGRDVNRGTPKDPIVTFSNITDNAAAPLQASDWYHKSIECKQQQKANLIGDMKHHNQKENQQQAVQLKTRLNMKPLKQMDHAYSAISEGVKRKSDDHSTAAPVLKKKRNCSSLMRKNPFALLQPASAQAVTAAASKTGAAGALSATVVDLSDDEVEVVEAPSAARRH